MAASWHQADFASAQAIDLAEDASAPQETPEGRAACPGRSGLLDALTRPASPKAVRAIAAALRSGPGRPAALALVDAPAEAARPMGTLGTSRQCVPLPLHSLVAPLVAWTRDAGAEPTAERAERLRRACADRDTVYANVIEASARVLGDQHRRDACTDIDLTLALIRLQTLVRCIGAAPGLPHRYAPWRVRVAAAPMEAHALGMAIASESFRAAGWDVDEEPCRTDASMRASLAATRCDALVLALSEAHGRSDRLGALAESIHQAREADAGLLVYVTGRAFCDSAADARMVGADGACASAVDAPRMAAHHLRSRDDTRLVS